MHNKLNKYISMLNELKRMFLGNSPKWYKSTIIGFLILNPIIYFFCNQLGLNGGFIVGWIFLLEFIFTLALALKCYPLQPGGLLAIQALAMGLTTPYHVLYEIEHNLEVILLLIFMVAGIFFMKNLMLTIFTKLLLKVNSKKLLSLLFCFSAAVLSAFLDALTVTAVLIGVTIGFYRIYHIVASGKAFDDEHNHLNDSELTAVGLEDLESFKGFLRDLVMHGAVGTALGGVCTIVGEPQNLLIANTANWQFVEFFLRMAPVTMPVFVAGLVTCYLIERFSIAGFGNQMPVSVKNIFNDYAIHDAENTTLNQKAQLVVESIVAILLVIALGTHVAAVGLIGLAVIILLTSFKGITEEHDLGEAFHEALPFTALLAVFFAIVSVINDQSLFAPLITFVLMQDVSVQPPLFFVVNGVLSAISDNVFVATIYINEVKTALDTNAITLDQFNKLAVAINTGTNIPSIATPNGQAAFLFLLTSSLAPLINLSYMRMVLMALPYTIVLSSVGFLSIIYFI